MTENLDRLDKLEPDWLIWLCEAYARRGDRAQIEAVLMDHGDDHPALTISALEHHPIFRWALADHSSRQKHKHRAEYYLQLHSQLWGGRVDPLPILKRPEVSSFFNHYYLGLRPVIIKEWASEWPALRTWDPSVWVERFADVEIEVSGGRTSIERFDRRFSDTQTMTTLGKFAHELLTLKEPSNDRYLIARNYALDRPELSPLLVDIDERPYFNPAKRAGSMALWFGPQGTITPLHHDTCQIMFVQIRGEKEITLIPPHAQQLFDQATSMYSDIDPHLDLKTTPQHPHQVVCKLQPGEALFIPVGWWHAVRSLSLSMSLAMTHFIYPNQFDWYRPGETTYR